MKSDFKEEVYLKLPPGFEDSEESTDTVLKLKNIFYGLVQDPKCWNDHLDSIIVNLGYKASVYDPCMYYGNDIFLLEYVDDILLFGKNSQVLR